MILFSHACFDWKIGVFQQKIVRVYPWRGYNRRTLEELLIFKCLILEIYGKYDFFAVY